MTALEEAFNEELEAINRMIAALTTTVEQLARQQTRLQEQIDELRLPPTEPVC